MPPVAPSCFATPRSLLATQAKRLSLSLEQDVIHRQLFGSRSSLGEAPIDLDPLLGRGWGFVRTVTTQPPLRALVA